MKYDLSFTIELVKHDRQTHRPSPRQLRVDAERCFRLAQGAASRHLAAELEEIGRTFEHEARELEWHAHFSYE